MSGNLKIAVYAISKNESAFVRRCIGSCKEADVFVLCDTGSDDDTASVASDCGAIVHWIGIKPWRFDRARDAALALVPSDVDVCVSLDLDEMLEPGWRQEIERLWVRGETTRLRYLFDWGGGKRFHASKIHSRFGYHWHHPCHEYVRPDMRLKERAVTTDRLLITHHPDRTKSRGQYLELLEMSVKEDPSCDRNAFYYARELGYVGRTEESAEAFRKYLAMPSAKWKPERASAMLHMAEAKRGPERTSLLRMATIEDADSRDAWAKLAVDRYTHKDWAECLHASQKAISIRRRWFYTETAWAFGPVAYDMAAIASYRLGAKDAAARYGEKALEMSPDDERLKRNLEWYLK